MDTSEALDIIDMIESRVKDMRIWIEDAVSASNSTYCEHMRLLKCQNMALSDQGMTPYLKLTRGLSASGITIDQILERIGWLKEEIKE
jgi:hypothetical protein